MKKTSSCIVVAFADQKGGVCKTTTSLAFASYLTKEGYAVLTVDLDQQGSFSKRTGVKDGLTTGQLMDAVAKVAIDLPDAAHAEEFGDVVIGDAWLAGADAKYILAGREYILQQAIAPARDEYDFILIDCPPNLGVLTTNAITAADSLVIPTTAEPQSVDGIKDLWDTVNAVKKYCNRDLSVDGMLVCKYRGTNSEKACMSALQDSGREFGVEVSDYTIPMNIAVNEAQDACRSIFSYAPDCKAAKAYESFIKTMLGE